MSLTSYDEFLATKRRVVADAGFKVDPQDLHPALFSFQREIVAWALQRGRAALFEDCGMGKALQSLVWGSQITRRTGGPGLILTPLAVASQTRHEGEKFGIPVTVCRSQADVRKGVNVANYEMLEHFDPAAFSWLCLDESSILKAFSGTMRREITEFGASIPYRLACTATPAPNDLIELTNHAEFLGILTGKEIIALFFTQDGNTTHKWRLKGHAKGDFWRWLATWAVAMRKPSDLGHEDGDFILPPLTLHPTIVDSGAPTGVLLAGEAVTLNDQRAARRESLSRRVEACAALVKAEPDEPWLIWCDLNDESAALTRMLAPLGAVEVRGSDPREMKEKRLGDFSEGRARILVSKPSLCGFGMNWQHCARIAFVGVSHSYEQFYQAMRRCWRFGQVRPVCCHIITSEAEGPVVRNLERKEREAGAMMENLVTHMQEVRQDGLAVLAATRQETHYAEDRAEGDGWRLYLGDCVLRMQEIETESVGLSIHSPPFPGLYIYSNSRHDVGNASDIEQMIEHYRFLLPELYRVTLPGRRACVHLCQLNAMKSRDGYVGLKDYRGAVIRMFQEAGWIYSGEATIEKNPQIQATRNKEHQLLFKSLATDAAIMRMALADYLLYFQKPGENAAPIRAGISNKYNPGGGWITEQEWIEWASPIWKRQTPDHPGGIRETNVLNVAQARETDDERHLCPLQLDVCTRAIKLWSNPGDLVLDPFMGIGSTGYQALLLGRRAVGCELKQSYFESAIRNLRAASLEVHQPTLFDSLMMEPEAEAVG